MALLYQSKNNLLLIIFVLLNSFIFESAFADLIIPQREFDICPGSNAKVSITVDRPAPAFVTINHEESNITYTYSSDSTNSFQISIYTPGTYIVTKYGGPDETTIDNKDTIRVSYLSNLSIELKGGGNFCNSSSPIAITATFTGTAPFTYIYRINNNIDSITTNDATVIFASSDYLEIQSILISDSFCSLPDAQKETFNNIIIPTPLIDGNPFSCFPGTAEFTTEPGSYSCIWQIPSDVKYINGSTGTEPAISVEWPALGEYEIRLQMQDLVNHCLSEWKTLPINVYAPPVISTIIDTSACINPDIPISITIPTREGEKIYWPTAGYTGSTKEFYVEGTFEYHLIDAHLCSDTGFVKISNICASKLYVPEAFTPNGDGLNDSFEIFGSYTELEFNIYSPTGQLLYSMHAGDPFWDGTCDGKNLPNGVYYWYIKYSDRSKANYSLNGTVTLIR
jgi:gliding motility-associated-like protein